SSAGVTTSCSWRTTSRGWAPERTRSRRARLPPPAARCRRRRAVKEIRLRTERRSQLVDITGQVREAVQGERGAAVAVCAPHTTAGVPINEHAHPAVARHHEAALEGHVR